MARKLHPLLKDIRSCRICVEPSNPKPLPHEPRPVLTVDTKARICISGQAPGTRVHKSGKPFTDPSGDRLRDWMGVDEDLFYDPSKIAIVPMGFCFPGLDAKGGDLPPRKECAKAWHGELFSTLESLDLILVVGMYAQKWHLRERCKRNLTETVRAWREYRDAPDSPRFLPLPHPSWRNNHWIRKNAWFETDLIPYLRDEIARLSQD